MVFVVGSPRSGTTWVVQMLGLHPMLIHTRESHAYPTIYPILERHSWRDSRCWTELEAVYRRARRERVGLDNYVRWNRYRQILHETCRWAAGQTDCRNEHVVDRLVHSIFADYFWRQGGTLRHLFLEKTPGHSLYSERILTAFPQARLLHVLRDGRDVCVSMQMRALKTKWSPADRRTQVETWVKHTDAVLRATQRPEFADRVGTIRYEDLKTAPQAQLQRLLAFLDLPATPAQTARLVDRNRFERKTKTGPGRHSFKGQVGQWPEYFSADDLELYTRLAGPLHEQCGYSLNGTRAAA